MRAGGLWSSGAEFLKMTKRAFKRERERERERGVILFFQDSTGGH